MRSLQFALREAVGEVSVNRMSADVIPLCIALQSGRSLARNDLGDCITCWPLHSENRRRSNRKDRDFDPIRSPWKIAMSISMIVTALVDKLESVSHMRCNEWIQLSYSHCITCK